MLLFITFYFPVFHFLAHFIHSLTFVVVMFMCSLIYLLFKSIRKKETSRVNERESSVLWMFFHFVVAAATMYESVLMNDVWMNANKRGKTINFCVIFDKYYEFFCRILMLRVQWWFSALSECIVSAFVHLLISFHICISVWV